MKPSTDSAMNACAFSGCFSVATTSSESIWPITSRGGRSPLARCSTRRIATPAANVAMKPNVCASCAAPNDSTISASAKKPSRPSACACRVRSQPIVFVVTQPSPPPIATAPAMPHSATSANVPDNGGIPCVAPGAPHSASPASANGSAMPSFIPPSPDSAKRTRSRSPGSCTCTSCASTGSVGARIAASSSAGPQPRPSASTAQTASSGTVTTIASSPRRHGTSHSLSDSGTRNRSPIANSDTSSATSTISRSRRPSRSRSRCSRSAPDGPSATPSTR